MSNAADKLLRLLSVLEKLNPDEAAITQAELLVLAKDVSPVAFPRFIEFTEGLVVRYGNSPIKQAQQRLFNEYFRTLEQATHLLAAKGAIEDAETPIAGAGATPNAVSLVPAGRYTPRTWCNLLLSAEIPEQLLQAVTAAQQRNRYVPSVLETMFLVLQTIDLEQAFRWQQDYIRNHAGALDADLVRDLLRAWLPTEQLPLPLLEAVLQWDGDENLGRQWPAVVHAADELLRRQFLRHWQPPCEPVPGAGGNRRPLLTHDKLAAETLTRWASGCVGDIGESVQFFITVSEQMRQEATLLSAWQAAALLRELKTLAGLFEPVILLSDLVLREPGGAARFAMALFGLGKTGTDLWRRRMQAQTEKLIRRLFLQGLRSGVPPENTIRQLCFDDTELFNRLRQQLDLGTRQFDSLKQLDRVVERLAAHYVSRREYRLTAQEIGRRFRCLMRVLHEDNLRRLLTAAQVELLAANQAALSDIMGLLGGARRYLDRRRDLDLELGEILAAEDAFAADLRQRRNLRLRILLVTAKP